MEVAGYSSKSDSKFVGCLMGLVKRIGRFNQSQSLRITVVDNHHIKTKCSQQIQITHNKFKTTHSKFKSFTTNWSRSQQITNHSQQIQITLSKLQIIDPTRCLQWPTVSGARRLKICHTWNRYPRKLTPYSSFLFELSEREPCFVFTVDLSLR